MLFGIQSKIFQQGWQKKPSKFLIISGQWVKNFRPFVKKWSRAARTAFYVFTGTVWKIYLPVKGLKFLLSFSDTEQKNFAFLWICFNGVVNSAFYVSIGTFRWKEFSRKTFKFSFLLRILTGKNSLFRQAFFGRAEETAFYVSIDTFWGEFFKKKYFCRFWTTSKTFSVITAIFYTSRGTF